MSEEALRYRERRGLLDSDEQMALLVMRVSGAKYGNNFFPQAAGVGFSFNPYAWSEYIDPSAGVLRLVFGLGTRAVDRSDDDYTRIVALNAPQRRPESNFDEVRQYAQRRVDYLDLTANQLVSSYFPDVIAESPGVPVEIFADIDERDTGLDTHTNRVLTFNNLLSNTDFVRDMREILKALEGAYSSPVDIEFTVNFFTPGKYNINLVQCRPMPAISGDTTYEPAPNVDDEHKIVEAHGAVIGHSRLEKVSRIIYIVPAIYGQLVERDRYAIAKLIGQINRDTPPKEDGSIVLLGPGRWGTSTPALGIPLSFNDIKTISVLCEIVTMHGSLVPDASLGTHFLNELVEMDILYMALYPGKGKNLLDSQILENAPNRLEELIPDAAKWGYVVRVIDAADLKTSDDETIMLSADAQNQAVICYRSK
jgi:hypothetical protein